MEKAANADTIMNLLHHKHNYQRFLSNVYETIKEREFFLKRSQVGMTEDVPKSFPKLLTKDFLLQQCYDTQREKMEKGEKTEKTLEKTGKGKDPRQKSQISKNIMKSIEEEQRQISRENMKMMGLNIMRIRHSPSSPQKSKHVSSQIMQIYVEDSILRLHPRRQQDQDQQHEQTACESQIIHSKVKHRAKSTFRSNTIATKSRTGTAGVEQNRKRKSISNPEYQNPIYDARIQSYRQLLFKLNFTYGVYHNMEKYEEGELKNDKKYKAWVGGGNNGNLIKSLLKRRFWWNIVEDKNYNINFIWTQLKNDEYFKKQQSAQLWFLSHKPRVGVNNGQEPDVESELQQPTTRNKSKLVVKYKRVKKDVDKKEFDGINKIMNFKEMQVYKQLYSKIKDKDYDERREHLQLKEITTEGERMHNHLTHNFYLGNKKALFYNLKEYYQLAGGQLFRTIPLTFHIKKGRADPQYKRFVTYYKKRQSFIKKEEKEGESEGDHRRMRNIWIVKPGELTNRGNGITVIDEIYELDGIIKSQSQHENGAQKTFIVQLYIDRPFLYKKRKFDIRHYMMITQLHGVMKAYWYQEGYIRTSSFEFDVHNFQREIHLTNDAVQKYTSLYGRYEPANKLSYQQFQRYLDLTYPKHKYSFELQILPRMKEICLDAVKSAFVKISPERYKHNFEIFGMDFMIDSEFRPWLIQINTNPCLELACPLLSRIIPNMVDQALRLSLDVVYPPPCHYPNTSKHLVPDASLQNMKFELIFDEKVDGQQLRNLYKRSKNNLLQEIGQISDDQVYEDEGKLIVLDQL